MSNEYVKRTLDTFLPHYTFLPELFAVSQSMLLMLVVMVYKLTSVHILHVGEPIESTLAASECRERLCAKMNAH